MRSLKFISVTALLGCALFASAQFVQPWTTPDRGYVSCVKACTSPTVIPAAVYDDFVSASTTNLTLVAWWGNVTSAAQAARPYYVAIYNNLPGACFPDITPGPIYQACVNPVIHNVVGSDCQGIPVVRFAAPLPGTGFAATAGTKYWIQISEDDASSVNPGVPDFRWSSHFGIVGCPAVQINSAGVANSPLQGCGALNDMAFAII